MNPPTHDPSIGTAFGRAVETVRTLLFRPFDAGRWIAIGFGAWLALLGEGGLGGNYNFGNQGNPQKSFQLDEAKRFLLENLYWILPVTILVLLLVAALAIALLWLSSRGRFLFLHSVARNSTAVEGPWREYAREANSPSCSASASGLRAWCPSCRWPSSPDSSRSRPSGKGRSRCPERSFSGSWSWR
jgi:hypothetical protein